MIFLEKKNQSYIFKKGKYKSKDLKDLKDLNYLSWIIKNIDKLEEQEKLLISIQIENIKKQEEKTLLENEINEEFKEIKLLKKQLSKLKQSKNTLLELKLNEILKESNLLKKQKEIEIQLIEEKLKKIFSIHEFLGKILEITEISQKGINRFSEKKIYKNINDFKELNKTLKVNGIKIDIIELLSTLKISELKKNPDLLTYISYEDFLIVSENKDSNNEYVFNLIDRVLSSETELEVVDIENIIKNLKNKI